MRRFVSRVWEAAARRVLGEAGDDAREGAEDGEPARPCDPSDPGGSDGDVSGPWFDEWRPARGDEREGWQRSRHSHRQVMEWARRIAEEIEEAWVPGASPAPPLAPPGDGIAPAEEAPACVMIRSRPGPRYAACVLACLSLGVAFVPVDRSWPIERVRAVARSVEGRLALLEGDSEGERGVSGRENGGAPSAAAVAECLLAEGVLILPVPERGQPSHPGRPRTSAADVPTSPPGPPYGGVPGPSSGSPPAGAPRLLPYCYLIHTSGTTGSPMAVLGSEQGVLCRALAAGGGRRPDGDGVGGELDPGLAALRLDRRSRLLARSPIGFVDSVFETLGPLLCGCDAFSVVDEGAPGAGRTARWPPALGGRTAGRTGPGVQEVAEGHGGDSFPLARVPPPPTHVTYPPALWAELCISGSHAPWRLPTRAATSSGAPLGVDLSRRVAALLGRSVALLDVWGCTEASGDSAVRLVRWGERGARSTDGDDEAIGDAPPASFYPLPGQAILVAAPPRPDGTGDVSLVERGETGRVLIAGRALAAGFAGDGGTRARRWNGRPADPGGGGRAPPVPAVPVPGGELERPRAAVAAGLGWSPGGAPSVPTVDTGDQGWIDEAGRLRLAGRSAISAPLVRGARVDPGAVEVALEGAVAQAVVRVFCSPAGRETVVAFLESPGGVRDAQLASGLLLAPDDLAARLRTSLAHLSPEHMPGLFACIARLPRSSSGKVDRGALRSPWKRPRCPDPHCAGEEGGVATGTARPAGRERKRRAVGPDPASTPGAPATRPDPAGTPGAPATRPDPADDRDTPPSEARILLAFASRLGLRDLEPAEDVLALGASSLDLAAVAGELGVDLAVVVSNPSARQLRKAIEAARGRATVPGRARGVGELGRRDVAPGGGGSPRPTGVIPTPPIRWLVVTQPPVASEGELAWPAVVMRDCVDAAPVATEIEGSLAVVACSQGGETAAVRIRDGAVLWRVIVPDRPTSAPAVVRGHVLVPCRSGRLFALDLATGAVAGSREIAGHLRAGFAVDPGDGRAWISTHDGILIGVDVDREDAARRCTAGGPDRSRPLLRAVALPFGELPISSNPLAGKSSAEVRLDGSRNLALVACLDGSLCALKLASSTSSGNPRRWRSTPGAGRDRGGEGARAPPILASPAIVPDLGLAIAADATGGVHGIGLEGGRTVWEARLEAAGGSPGLEQPGSRGDFGVFAPIVAARVGEVHYAIMGASDGSIHVVEAATGQAVKVAQLPARVTGLASADDPATGGRGDAARPDEAPLPAPHVAVTCEDGTVAVLEISPPLRQGDAIPPARALATFRAPGPVFASPLVLGGRVLVGTRADLLVAFDLAAALGRLGSP